MKEGFYLSTVTEITGCGTDYKVIFTVNIYGRKYHPSLILDLDKMDKQTAFFMIIAVGGCTNMFDELQYCIGKEMTILVTDFKYPKVLLTYPREMFQILKRNEPGYIYLWQHEYVKYLDYIVGGLRNSYNGKDRAILYYESLFDDDFAKQLLKMKKLHCPYVIPENYYADNSGPAFK